MKKALAEMSDRAMAEAFNTNAIAMLGMGNVATQSLAPAFKSIVDGVNDMILGFIKSYQEGGNAKTFMDGLAVTLKGTADAFVWLGAFAFDVFETIDGAIYFFQALLGPLIDAVGGAVTVMIDYFRSYGDVLKDVFTLNWSAIQSDIASGAQRIAAAVGSATKQMGADAAANYATGVQEWAAGDGAMQAAKDFHDKLWGAAGATPGNDKPGKPQDNGGITPDAKNKKDKGLGEIETPKMMPIDHSQYDTSVEEAMKTRVGLPDRDPASRGVGLQDCRFRPDPGPNRCGAYL